MARNVWMDGGYYQTRGSGTGRTQAKLIPYPERTGGMTFGAWKALKESYHIEVLKRMDICLICRCKIKDDDRPVIVEYDYKSFPGEYMICRYCYDHFDEYEEWRTKKRQGEFRKLYAWEVYFTKPGSDKEDYTVRVMHSEDEIEPQMVEQFGEGTKIIKTVYMGEERQDRSDKFAEKYKKERIFRERNTSLLYYQKRN